jgi:hypothetical protein
LNIENTTTYDVVNPGPDSGQTQQCGRVKLVKGIITFPLLIIGSSTEIHILTNNKPPVKIRFHSRRQQK